MLWYCAPRNTSNVFTDILSVVNTRITYESIKQNYYFIIFAPNKIVGKPSVGKIDNNNDNVGT